MIYYKQTIMSYNTQIYIPTASAIHGAEVSTFERGNVKVELPALLYSIMPMNSDRSISGNSEMQGRVRTVSEVCNNSRWRNEGIVNDLTLLRVFLVPDAATTGGAMCPWAGQTSTRHQITNLNYIELNKKGYHVYIEQLVTIATSERQAASNVRTPSSNTAPLGPVITTQQQHRTIV